MSYIITAEVFRYKEENFRGDIKLVNARILSESEGLIIFDIPGDFLKQKELTKELCLSLIDAGFISFSINHSY